MGCLKKILMGVGVLVVLAVIVVMVTNNGSATSQLAAVNVPISDINFTELDEVYQAGSKYTDIQKEETWKKYDGKKVKWTGAIADISETFGTLQLKVKMKEDTFTFDLAINMKDDQKEKALKLNVGDSVVFTGILDEWGTIMPITLSDGEITQ